MAFFFSPDTAGKSRRTVGNTRGFVISDTDYGYNSDKPRYPCYSAHGKIEVVQEKVLNKYQQLFKKISLRVWIISGAVLVLVLSYILIFFIPKAVTFSYAGQTCVRQLSLFPGVQKQTDTNDTVTVRLEDTVSIGSLQVASTKACFTPKESFEAGTHVATLAPWGGPIFAKQFAVTVPDAPAVVASAAAKGEISAVRPLEIQLGSEDTVHRYVLATNAAEKSVECSPASTMLTCNIADLALDHGKQYSLSLSRQIPDITDAEAVTTFDVTTLSPVNVTSATVTEGQVIYDTPAGLQFSTDKPLANAKVTLEVLKGEQPTPVTASVVTEGTIGTVAPAAPLDRKSQYILTIVELNGSDGSSLAEPYTVRFATSGGPKVSAVSVGSSLVAQNARITVTFDQPIDGSVDVTKFIRATGATGTVSKLSPTQVAITLQNAPLCSAFSLVVDKGIKSGSNGTLGEEAWKFDSRVICGYASVIGYSVKGRAIVAYYFGTGSSTILFTGGIHGSEGSSTTTMQAWANYLQSNGFKIPADKRVVIVPNVSPDGIAAGSRNNANNVNLGRNFPTANWKADIQTTSGLLVNGGGTSAASEPEAKALLTLTRQLKPRLEVSFHAQGRLVGANKYGDSVSIGNTYAGIVGYQTMFYNAEAVMGYEMTGEYEDWMGEEMGTPAILIELPSYSGNYLNSQLTALLRMLTV